MPVAGDFQLCFVEAGLLTCQVTLRDSILGSVNPLGIRNEVPRHFQWITAQGCKDWGARPSRSQWGASRAPLRRGWPLVNASDDRPQREANPECVWRDAKHRARDARAPRNRRGRIGSAEIVEEAEMMNLTHFNHTLP